MGYRGRVPGGTNSLTWGGVVGSEWVEGWVQRGLEVGYHPGPGTRYVRRYEGGTPVPTQPTPRAPPTTTHHPEGWVVGGVHPGEQEAGAILTNLSNSP